MKKTKILVEIAVTIFHIFLTSGMIIFYALKYPSQSSILFFLIFTIPLNILWGVNNLK